MNTLRILCLLILATTASRAADWQAMADSSAVIKVIHMAPVPLVESDAKVGWLKVPSQLTKFGASIYVPETGNDDSGGRTGGVADITVVKSGYLLISCNYSYQGNSSGNWQKDVWDTNAFKRNGWHLLTKNELGGLLVNAVNQEQTVFSKKVTAGQNLRIRCNKYQPPLPIVLGTAL